MDDDDDNNIIITYDDEDKSESSSKRRKVDCDTIINLEEEKHNKLLTDTLYEMSRKTGLHNPRGLVPLIQDKYQELNPDYVNDPLHICENSTCKMKHLPVIVQDPNEGMMKSGNDIYNHSNYLFYFNPREKPKASWGKFIEFTNLFVCPATFKIHACGEMCVLKSVCPERNDLLVCPLTGLVITPEYSDEDDWKSSMLLLPNEAYVPVSQTASRVKSPEKIAESQLELVRKLLKILLLSDERQIFECKEIIRQFTERLTVIRKSYRKQKAGDKNEPVGGYMFSTRINWMLQASASKNTYFSYFDINSTCLSHIRSSIRESILSNSCITTPLGARNEAKTKELDRLNRERRDLLSKLYSKDDVAADDVAHRQFIELTIEFMAQMAMRIWGNLQHFVAPPPPKTEAELASLPVLGVPKQLGYFKNMVIPILYLMKDGMKISVNNNNDNVITVIPKVHLAKYLPPENSLSSFSTNGLPLKNMSITHSYAHIRYYFSIVSKTVPISELEIKIK